MKPVLYILLTLMSGFLFLDVQAQSEKGIRGVVVKKGTKVRVANARVYNKRTNFTTISDKFGFFNILAAENDSLFIDAEGYAPASVSLDTLKDVVVSLTMTNMLNEVIVKGSSRQIDLKEAADDFRSKGIFYNGKPPIGLLAASPVTFFNEILSKDAKRAKRFSKYAQGENEYYEISARFSDALIKRTVPITDKELGVFKSDYQPSIDQIREWNDFDLINYIKKSYEQFKESRKGQ